MDLNPTERQNDRAGGFQFMEVPKMDAFYWNILLNWILDDFGGTRGTPIPGNLQLFSWSDQATTAPGGIDQTGRLQL